MQAENAGATLAPCSPRRTLSAYAAISSVFRIRAYAGNVRNWVAWTRSFGMA